MLQISDVIKFLGCFPKSYMNQYGECILSEKGNVYFSVKECETETDVKCKLLEYCSRSASKEGPYKSEKRNIEFRNFVRGGINKYIGVDFSADDIRLIYEKLGNCVNHQLTINFIASGYDMNILKRR